MSTTPSQIPRSQGPQRVMKAAALRTEPLGVGRTPAPGTGPATAPPSTTPFQAARREVRATSTPAPAPVRATPAPAAPRASTAPPHLAPRPRYVPKSTRPQGHTQPPREADDDEPPTSWRLVLATLAAMAGITVVFWYQAQHLMSTIR